MNAATWKDLKGLLADALERPREEREQYLAERTDVNEDIRSEASRLLAVGPEVDGFLETPAVPVLAQKLRALSLAFTGCSIGDFEIREELGRGSSGVVYEATQISLGRPAAVKILAHHLCASQRAREQFRREAEAASKLRHDSIVSIYSFGEQGGVSYIAMELVRGDNLRELIEARAASQPGRSESRPPAGAEISDLRVAAGLVEQLARGLQHCHESGVIHRDVKPHNIIIDEHGRPRLVDFGLAKDSALEGFTATGVLAGTPHYMSPEQASRARADVDLRTDIYSLGVVLYELLTLQRPFEAAAQADLLKAIVHDEPRHAALVNPQIPADLAAVVMKALAKRPGDRYASAAAMADDLRRFLSGERTLAPRYSLLRRIRDWSRRHRAMVVSGLAVLGLGLFVSLQSARGTSANGLAHPTPSRIATVLEMRAAFEKSLEGRDEQQQLELRRDFNRLLINYIGEDPDPGQ